MMRILVTNDDGIDAYGIHILEQILREFSDDITIVAPSADQSGKGRALSLRTDISFTKRDEKHYAVGGTPADCIMIALNVLFKDSPPDFVVSGINHGMNVADDVGYSGTVGAALEAAIVGISAIAVSQKNGSDEAAFEAVRQTGAAVMKAAFETVLPQRTILNVNFPAQNASPVKGIRPALLDKHKFSDEILTGTVPDTYRIGPQIPYEETLAFSDRYWLNKGYVSFTPLGMDATAHNEMVRISADNF
jgi:5'-nucleotidase